MTAFTNIVNALVAVGAKPFATTIQALRDNPIAIAEGDPTAPVNSAAWHPYNKVINNDGNTGRIWSFPVDGAVATVTTPDFANGWEYALLIDELRSSSGSAGSLLINWFRETGGAYSGGVALSAAANVSNAITISPWVELLHVRKARKKHVATAYGSASDTGDSVAADNAPYSARVGHTTPQKILRAQLSLSVGNMTGSGSTGAIYLYRRKDSGAQ